MSNQTNTCQNVSSSILLPLQTGSIVVFRLDTMQLRVQVVDVLNSQKTETWQDFLTNLMRVVGADRSDALNVIIIFSFPQLEKKIFRGRRRREIDPLISNLRSTKLTKRKKIENLLSFVLFVRTFSEIFHSTSSWSSSLSNCVMKYSKICLKSEISRKKFFHAWKSLLELERERI